MNIDTSGALFAVRNQYTQYKCKEGAKDVNVHLGITITLTFSGGFGAEKNHDGMQQMDGTSSSCFSKTTSKI